MPKYPVLRAKSIIRILHNLGFEQIRQIARDIGLSMDEFMSAK